MEYWITTIKDILKDEAVLGIAGNKQDLFKNKKVKNEAAKKYAHEKNVIFELISAKNNKIFEKFLEDLLKQFIEKRRLIVMLLN